AFMAPGALEAMHTGEQRGHMGRRRMGKARSMGSMEDIKMHLPDFPRRIQTNIAEHVRTALIRVLLSDALHFSGLVKVRELPRDCEFADFMAWWPRLTERERERWTAY